MTALCTGGTSAPKPGTEAFVNYSSGLIATILSRYGAAWLIPVIPLFTLPPLELAVFCASDPPAIPTFTSAETEALLGLSFGADFDSGLGKLKDLILHTLWYDSCQCTSGTAVVLPPAAAPPTGTPIFLPPTGGAVPPCRSYSENSVAVNASATTAGSWLHGQPDGIGTAGVSMLNGSVTTVVVALKNTVLSGSGPTGSAFVSWANALGTTLRNDSLAVTPGTTVTKTLIPPATADNFVVGFNTTGSGTFTTNGSTVLRYCNGDTPGVQDPCCPPDQSTQAYLDLILKMVTLLQRQAVPFGYVSGAAHSALSGSGELAVQGLLGFQVDTATVPARAGFDGGTPDLLFDLGRVSIGTADGWLETRRINADPYVWMPAGMSAITRIGYTIPGDMTVTITELVREP